MAINVTRISMIGFYPERYTLIHGPYGSMVAAWVTLLLITAVTLLGVRRELLTVL
jgi:hypothetical protein